MPPETIGGIVAAGLCQGCGACVAATGGALRMELGDAGYFRPRAQRPLSAAEEEVGVAVCSGAHIAHDASTIRYHPLWGPLVGVRTGYSTDPEIRYAGSSGGVISAVALHLIESGAVDHVLHVAAAPDDPFGTLARPSRSRADIFGATGSRYAPSTPLAGLEEHLAAGKRFAVVGKPCDIAALRRMAKRDARINAQVPFMLAFICAGVPSRLGTMEVVRALGAEPEDVEEFHYRGQGWPGFARARLSDGREPRMDYNSSWGRILNRHLQFRCKICPDGTGEFADLVCADAWYGKDGYPDFAERDGRSLILTRTAGGEALLGEAVAAGAIAVESLDVDEIAAMQPYQAARKKSIVSRLAGVRAVGRRAPRYRRLDLLKLAVGAGPVFNARSFLGMIKRARGGQGRA